MPERGWYVYQCPPVDDWDHWCDVAALFRSRMDIAPLFNKARQLVKEFTDWEGDGRWRFSTLPNPDGPNGTEYLFVIKQVNNGTTFVVSPFPLYWLEPWRVPVREWEVDDDDMSVDIAYLFDQEPSQR